MGLLVDGQWQDKWYDTKGSGGNFQREAAQLRNWVTADGQAGPSGKGGYKAESGRYHLYVSMACPWAHRTLIFRSLKGLEKHIDVSVVATDMLDQGWSFDKKGGSTGDALFDFQFVHELYTLNESRYSGRVTVPILWDKRSKSIVSNESSEIIRMFNSAFNDVTGNTLDFYPDTLQADIDEINAYIYDNINNGVYKTGFATTPSAYEKNYLALFEALDIVESRLDKSRYLVGDQLTEADWRLFTTLIRFDAVYFSHFKCNLRMIDNYPNLSEYVRELYQYPGVKETTNFEHIKRHYYFSHTSINPTQIVPLGPKVDYDRRYQR